MDKYNVSEENVERIEAIIKDVENGDYTIRYTQHCHCKIRVDQYGFIQFRPYGNTTKSRDIVDDRCYTEAIICGFKSGEMLRTYTDLEYPEEYTQYYLLSKEGEAPEELEGKIEGLSYIRSVSEVPIPDNRGWEPRLNEVLKSFKHNADAVKTKRHNSHRLPTVKEAQDYFRNFPEAPSGIAYIALVTMDDDYYCYLVSSTPITEDRADECELVSQHRLYKNPDSKIQTITQTGHCDFTEFWEAKDAWNNMMEAITTELIMEREKRMIPRIVNLDVEELPYKLKPRNYNLYGGKE